MSSSLFALAFDSGIYRNGTRYQAKGRWYDCALIRFFEKTIRAIGGWEKVQETVPEVQIGSALFTGIDGTAFSVYTPDLGFTGGTNPDSADPGAYQIASNKLKRPENVSGGVGYAHFTADLRADQFRIECDMQLRAYYGGVGPQSHGAVTFRGNNLLGAGREYIKVVAVTAAADTVTIYWQRITDAGSPESGTLVTNATIAGAAFRLVVEVAGDLVTVTRQPLGGGASTAVGSFTLSTPWNDASHRRFGVDSFYVNTSGGALGNTWDNYNVYALSFVEDIDLSSYGTTRKMIAWLPNDAAPPFLALGTNTSALVFSTGTLTDITPSSFDEGAVDTENESGQYGVGPYGVGNYGEGDPLQSGDVEAGSWQFDIFGQYLVGVHNIDGRLLVWDLMSAEMEVPDGDYPDAGATVSGTVPVNNSGVVVTAERFVFLLGADNDPRLVAWPSRETLTDWVPSDTNSAGNFPLPGNGIILCGLRGAKSTLIWTSEDLFEAQYIGGTLIYSFRQVGQKCGSVSRHAATTVDGKGYWMDFGAFFCYDGTVRPLPCDVADAVFKDFNKTQAAKVFAMPMARYGEIWWFYPSAASQEPDRYVVYNYRENHWTISPMATRTAGIDRGAGGDYPIMANADALFFHERGSDHDGADTPFLESGPLELGDRVMNIHGLVPDEATAAGQELGSTELRLITSSRPDSVETTHGPYTLSARTNLRKNARIVRVRHTEIQAGDWRIGEPALEVSPGGLR